MPTDAKAAGEGEPTMPAAAVASDLSVMIPTFRRPQMLGETLESLGHCVPVPAEVVVVDGDPDAGARSVVEAFADAGTVPSVRYLTGERGSHVQRNLGIDAASREVVLFVDDDVYFDPAVFGVIEAAFDDRSVVGATGAILEPTHRSFGNKRSLVRRLVLGGPDGSMTAFGYPRQLQDLARDTEVEFMQGCLMAARKDVAARVRFDERLGGGIGYAGLEDEDFSYRLSRVGRVLYLSEAVVHHRNTGFRSRDPRFFGWLMAYDRAYLFRKNFHPGPLTRLQFATLIGLLIAHRLVNREWTGAVGLLEGSRDAWRVARAERRGKPVPAVVPPPRSR